MAAISQTIIFKHISVNKDMRISIQISLKFFPKDPIDNESALLQVMAWRRKGYKSFKSLSEPRST